MSKSTQWSDSKESYDDEDPEQLRADGKSDEQYSKLSHKAAAFSEREVLEKLQSFFYEDETLANHFERFIDDHSHIVDLNNEEYKLEYTQVFNEYKSLFEEKIEDFIHKHLKVSIQDAYMALKKKVDSEEDSAEAFFAQVLIAVTDFDVFMSMMKDSARKQSSRK